MIKIAKFVLQITIWSTNKSFRLTVCCFLTEGDPEWLRSTLYNLMLLISKVSNDDVRHAGVGLQMVLFQFFGQDDEGGFVIFIHLHCCLSSNDLGWRYKRPILALCLSVKDQSEGVKHSTEGIFKMQRVVTKCFITKSIHILSIFKRYIAHISWFGSKSRLFFYLRLYAWKWAFCRRLLTNGWFLLFLCVTSRPSKTLQIPNVERIMSSSDLVRGLAASMCRVWVAFSTSLT